MILAEVEGMILVEVAVMGVSVFAGETVAKVAKVAVVAEIIGKDV